MADETAPSAPALKEIFNLARLRHIARETAAIYPAFDTRRFIKLASNDLESLGIMQRMRQVATSLHETLPGGFKRNVAILSKLAPRIDHGFVTLSLSEYVALYGEADFHRSMDALKFLTRFGSAEFAIRPFLLRDLDRTLGVMRIWALDDNEHVRRLASEGCRPRLPWSFRIQALIDDPTPVAAILDPLNGDPSLYVRKSVANHLNDITKDHPDWVLATLSRWPMDNPHTASIAKQALRTLIKKGDLRALAVVGASGKADVAVDLFSVAPATVRLGDRIRIAARFMSTAATTQHLVVDYAIHYVKKSGAQSRKVFKWKVLDIAAGDSVDLAISQIIRDFTTRKHHPGHHAVELLINGEVLARSAFDLRV